MARVTGTAWLGAICIAGLGQAVAQRGVPPETASCGSNIVSATVVATFCGHREGDNEIMDLFILWRGRPGWFQRSERGAYGTRGSHVMGGRNGRVTEYKTYGDITIGFEADFDVRAVTIGARRIALDTVNTVLVDRVDLADASRTVSTRRIEPRMPLLGDSNEVLIRRSRELERFLQCEVAMPVPRNAQGAIPQPPVITVCEKLRARR